MIGEYHEKYKKASHRCRWIVYSVICNFVNFGLRNWHICMENVWK